MPFSVAAKNLMLDTLTTIHAAAFSGAPGATGANELSGGAYARKPATFAAASGGSRALSADVTLDIPAGATVAYTGYFSALTGGTFLGYFDATDETYGSAGTYKITAAGTTLSITG